MDQPQTTGRQAVVVWVIMAVILVLALAGVVVALTRPSDKSKQSTGNQVTKANQESDDSTSIETGQASSNQNAQKVTISFTDEGFSPSSLTVKKGTVITVVNQSSKSVQFSSDDHPTHTHNDEMNMKTLAPGTSGTFTANTVGTHGFHDHIDDSKVGTLTVTQ